MSRTGTAIGMVVFMGGFASLAYELLAVRLMAPYFGTTPAIWTNVIAVVLGALALGYAVGGRMAPSTRLLVRVTLAAALLAALAPPGVVWLAPFFLPDGLRLEDAYPLLSGGSLAASCLLFGPPVFLLGWIAPIAIRLQSDESSTGRVLALSTLGGLLAVFVINRWLVPQWGSRATLYATSTMLAASSLCLRFTPRSVAGIGALAVAGLMAPPVNGTMPPAGARITASVETPVQFARVIQFDGDGHRWLQVNECLDSFQSVQSGEVTSGGLYYDALALAAGLTDASAPRVLILGLGAGSVVPSLHAAWQARVTGIEIDQGLLDLARLQMGLGDLESEGLEVVGGWDARVFLDRAAGQQAWDVVILDAYRNQVDIPWTLVSQEAFKAAHAVLSPGGVLVLNIAALGPEDPVLTAIASTAGAVFGSAGAYLIRDQRNVLVIAPDRDIRQVSQGSPLIGTAKRLRRIRPAPGAILTDDRPILEALQAASMRRGRKG